MTCTSDQKPGAVSREVVSLFQDLIWPAAAGNVAWAFFTVVITRPFFSTNSWSPFEHHAHWSQAITLFLLALYLMAEWVDTNRRRQSMKRWYWVADAALAVTIVGFAITVADNKSLTALWWLMTIFLVGILGHSAGLWNDVGDDDPHYKMAKAHFLGLVIVLIALAFKKHEIVVIPVWMEAVAVAVVIYKWSRIHWPIVPKS